MVKVPKCHTQGAMTHGTRTTTYLPWLRTFAWYHLYFVSNAVRLFSIARLSIFAALNGPKTNGHSYNISEQGTSWSVRWPLMAKEFGLVGVGPTQNTPTGVELWAFQNKEVWKTIVAEHGLREDSTLEASR